MISTFRHRSLQREATTCEILLTYCQNKAEMFFHIPKFQTEKCWLMYLVSTLEDLFCLRQGALSENLRLYLVDTDANVLLPPSLKTTCPFKPRCWFFDNACLSHYVPQAVTVCQSFRTVNQPVRANHFGVQEKVFLKHASWGKQLTIPILKIQTKEKYVLIYYSVVYYIIKTVYSISQTRSILCYFVQVCSSSHFL